MNPDKITTLIGVLQLSSTALMGAFGVNESYVVAANSIATALGFYFTNKQSKKAASEVQSINISNPTPAIDSENMAAIVRKATVEHLAKQLKKQL